MKRVGGLASVLLIASVASAGPVRIAAPPSCRAPYAWRTSLALDNDGDGYWEGGVTRACVKELPPNPSTPFHQYTGDDHMQYVDVATANGPGDCDDYPDPIGYETFRLVVGGSDPEHTGHVASITVACVGVQSIIDGRRYYTRGGGDQSTWLDVRDVVAVDSGFFSAGFHATAPEERRRAAAPPAVSCGLGLHAELVVLDTDQDGHPESGPVWRCVGRAAQHDGRTYFDACVDSLGFCAPSFTLLAARDALAPSPLAAAGVHRRAVQQPRVFFLDADGDGFGDGPPIVIYPGMPILSRWVLRDGDCNDANPFVHDWRPGLLPDCNGDAIVESADPQTVCVGDPETFTWTDETGNHSAIRYRDVTGRFWIDESVARRKDGKLLVEPACD